MKLISWNVNGLRAAMGKGFTESFDRLDADVFRHGAGGQHDVCSTVALRVDMCDKF